MNAAVDCHYFPPGLRKTVTYIFLTVEGGGHDMGVKADFANALETR